MDALMDPAVLTDTEVLEALEFELHCAHGQHHSVGWHHGGPATHWIRAVHNCVGGTSIYPACEPFARYVLSKYFEDWMCAHCGHVDQGRRMAYVAGRITK